MPQHKWHKEIKAWADGAEIECRTKLPNAYTTWIEEKYNPKFDLECLEFRIKPQPKEPQYLYVWHEPKYGKSYITANTSVHSIPAGYEYIGKIKLEVDDE